MPRKRAVKVCAFCHSHKIRCDVDLTGVPCSKCVEVREECVLRIRKAYPTRKKGQTQDFASESAHTTPSDNDSDIAATLAHHDLSQVVAAAVPEPSSRLAHFFVGDGGYGAILDAIDKTADRQFHIFAAAEKALDVEDLQYLKVKGCFTLPEERKQLLQAYFQFVHPSFPVIDAKAFLAQYTAHGFEGINLLLLWSIFSVSASYVPCLAPGRKECKAVYVARAKLLFDLGQENDKIVLVQAALLLSFWFTDMADVKQSWYWTGVAFSIAQSFGLHALTSSRPRSQKEIVWRNVWLCCLLRDTSQAFGRGRPLRLSLIGSDLYPTEISTYQFADLVLHDELLYSPREAAELETLWQNLLSISNVLRDMKATKRPFTPAQATKFGTRLQKLECSGTTITIRHVERHLELHRCAARIAWAKLTQQMKEQELASNDMTAVLHNFIDDDDEESRIWAAPVVVPLLVPAIATYLTALKENDDLAPAKLDIYGYFLTAIEDNYPAASMLKRVSNAAQEAIVGKRMGERGKEEGKEIASQFDDFGSLGQEDLFGLSSCLLFKTGDNIFTDEDTSAKKKGDEPKKGMMTSVAQESRLALARLKDVVGARKYLGDRKVRNFMRDVKNRLEERFDKLEEALTDPGNTRKIVPSRTQGSSTRSFNPWEKQDLGKLWDINKWADMQQKMDKFMEKYLTKIKLAHCTAKKIKALPKDKTKNTPAQQMTRDACPVYNAVVRGWKDAQRANFGVPWSGPFISGRTSS
ncbi:uncharacterized protein N0V89_006620 [Didymosphaeria variabile]|uniref:Zn(2)-C6 fungal-type domain-containing protein n=1 Tax=Didymosphaeria variabile TaxID=1932322 RepID=A0A9W9CA38_9PLEO|nr:uncharacterized protein N0V89_006620 [Didymosphaeria variabile]KAJ4351281.1 hypothetical protein N0V89_006620 [Didymosphaeria variabile]